MDVLFKTEELIEAVVEFEPLEDEMEDELLHAERVIKPNTKQIENICFFIIKIIP